MNITAEEDRDLIPTMDIVLYRTDSDLYVEYANIERKMGKWIAEAYRPLSFEGFDALLKGLKIKSGKSSKVHLGFSGMLPKNLLMYNPCGVITKLLWLCPGKLRGFTLGRNADRKKLFYPHLLFQVNGRTVKVYAVKTTNVNSDTIIYRAPFPNVYTGNDICWGSVRFDDLFSPNHEKYMNRIEDAFFNSAFTTEMMSFNKTKSPTLDLLKQYSKSQKPFPNKEMVKIDNFYNVFSR